MDKGKNIGICCILAAVAILAAALIYRVQESGDSYGTESGNAAKVTFSAVSAQEVNAVQATESVATATENVTKATENAVGEGQPAEQTAEAEEPDYGEYVQAGMEIRDMNDEVLSLIGVTKDRLAEEIRTFANGYGFASMTETHYYGETTINHKKNTVSAGFYFQTPESGTYKFHVIIQRDKKTFRFEPW